MCHACRRLAEEPERAGKDEEVPAAGGAGVPHGPDGHSGAAGGAGEELPDHLGRLQEDHREARSDLSCSREEPPHVQRKSLLIDSVERICRACDFAIRCR